MKLVNLGGGKCRTNLFKYEQDTNKSKAMYLYMYMVSNYVIENNRTFTV